MTDLNRSSVGHQGIDLILRALVVKVLGLRGMVTEPDHHSGTVSREVPSILAGEACEPAHCIILAVTGTPAVRLVIGRPSHVHIGIVQSSARVIVITRPSISAQAHTHHDGQGKIHP